LFVKTYDESVFAHVTKQSAVTEESRKKKKDEEPTQDTDYFDIVSANNGVNRERLDPNQDLPFSYAFPFSAEYTSHLKVIENQMTCQLDSHIFGKQFEVQVELLDSYRTINKATPFSQVMITPEFFGRSTPDASESQEESPKPMNSNLAAF
jgi:hypothetical protein